MSAYDSLVSSLASTYCPSCPSSLALQVMLHESSGNPTAVSSAGAEGLFQLMPTTAASLGVSNPFDPTQNATAGLTYLQQLYNQFGNWSDALIAYNEGPGTLSKGTIYPSSQSYADSILSAAGIDSSNTSDFASTDLLSASSDSSALWDLPSLTGLSWPVLAAIAAAIVGLGLALRD